MDDRHASSSLRTSQPSAGRYATLASAGSAARQRPFEKSAVSFSQEPEGQPPTQRIKENNDDARAPSILSSLHTRMTAALSEGGPGRAVSGSAPSAMGSDGAPQQLKSILVKRGSQEGQTRQEVEETEVFKGSGPWSHTRSSFARRRRRCLGCWEKFQDMMMPFWENEVDFVLKEESERQAFAGKVARPIRSKGGSESRRLVKVQESAMTARSSPSAVSAASTMSNFTLKRKPLRANMDFFGLRFRDKKIEEEYEFNNNRLFKYRNCFIGAICLTTGFLNYVLLLMTERTKAYMLGSLAPIIGFHLILNSSIVCSLIFTFVHRLPFTKNHQEQVTYFLISAAYLTVALVVCVSKIQLYWGPAWDSVYLKFLPDTLAFYDVSNYSPIKDPVDPRFALFLVLNEILLTSIADSYYYFLTLLFDSIIPSRSRYIAIHQTVMVCLSTVVTFMGVAKFPLLVYPALFRLSTMILCYVTGLSGQFAVEVQRRGLFFEWYAMRKKLTEIQQEKKKAQKKHATSGLDDLRSYFLEIRNISLQAKVRCKEYDPTPEINQILELVEKGLDLLANSWNLYSVEMDDSLKHEGFMQALDVDTKAKRVIVADPDAPLATRISVPASREFVASGPACSIEVTESATILSGVLATKHTTQLVPVVGIDISYDMLELSKSCPDSVLLEVGYVLLSRSVADWACEDRVLRQFLHKAQGLYHDNPYHSAVHGSMVAHTMGCLLRALGVNRDMTSVSSAACAVAALCHDVGHPGRNNNFFVASRARLAVLYNDKSVLENFHSSLAFRILQEEDCNIFAYLTDFEFKDVRTNMIDLILATDMKTHFDFLSRFRNRRQAVGFNFHKVPEDQWLVAEMCIRASDLGHAVVEWDQHFEWSCRVVTEFYLQGDQEHRMGLHISPLCDRADHGGFAKSQQGFLGYVVKPLVLELAECDTSKRIAPQLLHNLEQNTHNWEAFVNEGVTVVLASSAVAYDIKYQGVPMDVDVSLLTRKHLRPEDEEEHRDNSHYHHHRSRRGHAMKADSGQSPIHKRVSMVEEAAESDDESRDLQLRLLNERLLEQQQLFEEQQQQLMKQVVLHQEQEAALQEEVERQRQELARQKSEFLRQGQAMKLLQQQRSKVGKKQSSRLSFSRHSSACSTPGPKREDIGTVTAHNLFVSAGELLNNAETKD